MSKSPTFYIHIGMMKTGTTSLQHYLYRNRGILKTRSVLYPCDKSVIRLKKHRCWSPNVNRRYEKKWAKTIRQGKDYSKVVISSEGFSYLSQSSIAKIGKLLQKYETKVIVYLRRYEYFYNSWYKQRIKSNGETCDFETFTKARINKFGYNRIIGDWATVFGKENIIIRIYDEQSLDTIDDFCHVVDIDTSDCVGIQYPRNISFDPTYSEFKRRINMSLQNRRQLDLLTKAMRTTYARSAASEENIKSYPFAESTLKILREQIEDLSHIFGQDYQVLLNKAPQVSAEIIHQTDYIPMTQAVPLIVDLVTRIDRLENTSMRSLFSKTLRSKERRGSQLIKKE